MGLDIRLPIGLLFSVVGALLVGYGALSNKAIYERSLGFNINLAWGVVVLLFGATMLILGSRGTKNRLAGGTRTRGSAGDASAGDKLDARSSR
ncbi:MAG: hypothetical protein WAL71_02775 [Terriglobales bacterium]|jgi:uncharacterized protein YhhL (DUF1145 family)